MALYLNGKVYYTEEDYYDLDASKYILPPNINSNYSNYVSCFLDEKSMARTHEKIKSNCFEEVKVVIHEAQLALNNAFPGEEHGINKFIEKWNKPDNYLGAHFFATDTGVYQFGDIDEIMYHCGASNIRAVGNDYSVGIERTVDINTNYSRAIYNQAKCAASVMKYYSILYKASSEDERDFIEKNIITHTQASTGLTLKEIYDGLEANVLLSYYGDYLSKEDISRLSDIRIIPSISNNLDNRKVKICPARLISGWYGGMETLKNQMIENIKQYNLGHRDALFEEIVYNKDYIEDVQKKRLLKK